MKNNNNNNNNNFQLTMSEEEIFDTFRYNQQYLIDNQIPEDVLRWALQRANEYLVADDEIFVQYPDYPEYFCSNYGRCISLKAKGREPKFLQPLTLTDKYTGYTFCRPEEKQLSITISRMVADIFCPNFLKGKNEDSFRDIISTTIERTTHGKILFYFQRRCTRKYTVAIKNMVFQINLKFV